MLYLTSKFHVNRINTFGFMEGRGAFEAPPSPQAPGTPKKPRPNRVKVRANERNMLGQHYPTLLGWFWLKLALRCSNDHNMLGNVAFTVIPRRSSIFTQTELFAKLQCCHIRRWIQTMENAKMYRYCYSSLPSWKYLQSHKQEQRA